MPRKSAGFTFHTDKFTLLAEFDGSVIAECTAGEVSARCKQFLDFRRKKPTPYMERLRFKPDSRKPADLDVRVLSDQDLEQAANEAKRGR